MKWTNRTILLILAFCVGRIDVSTQTRVTFDNAQFMVNNRPFFPIGWYGGERPAALDSLSKSGVNVVLAYWNSVIDAYVTPTKAYDISTYHKALRRFLDSACSIIIGTDCTVPTGYAIQCWR